LKPLTKKEAFIVHLFFHEQSATAVVATLAIGIAIYITPMLLVAEQFSGIVYLGIPLFSGFAVVASIIVLPLVMVRRALVQRSHTMANKVLAYKHGLHKA